MNSYLSDDDIEALQTSGLPTDRPYLIGGVTYTQFSIARHHGGIGINGVSYVYHTPTDELIRWDVKQWIEARRKAAKQDAIKAEEAKQRQLFGDSE